ncbi:hypothetical protein [Nocardioides aquiterrae]|uniref:Lipoprotein n=1 Tax=Nocardioides aquiterrae TaxID=203799 RepID=A0ABP4EU20_9ACTN
MTRTHLRAATAVLLTAAVVLGSAGCSGSDSSDSDEAGGAPTPSATSATTEQSTDQTGTTPGPAPLALTSGGPSGSICLLPSAARDLAWFDVTWKAGADLDALRFRLTDPVGVRQRVGDTINVPPVNFGGSIAYGGSASWPERAKALDTRTTSWAEHAPMWTWSPAEGETGLVVLHLVLDEKALHSKQGASFSGIRATYRTADGAAGSVAVPAQATFRARARC